MSLGNTFRNRETFIPPKLQITAMMDMFTIIVFFLLFSYADRPDEIALSADIALPMSSTDRDYDNTIKVFLSATTLKIEEEIVANIHQDKIVGYNPDKPQESSIYKTLEKIRKARISDQSPDELLKTDSLESSEKSSSINKPQILFFCDKSVPFKVINTVMKTIGMVGYPNMQFAVTGEQ